MTNDALQERHKDLRAESVYAADQVERVWCEDCDNAIRHLDGTKSDIPTYRWLCAQAPRPDVGNFVSRHFRITEPFYRCSVVNTHGQCPDWTPRRESSNG